MVQNGDVLIFHSSRTFNFLVAAVNFIPSDNLLVSTQSSVPENR
jgi:hypothetical protein